MSTLLEGLKARTVSLWANYQDSEKAMRKARDAWFTAENEYKAALAQHEKALLTAQIREQVRQEMQENKEAA